MDIEKRAHHLSERLNYIRDIFDGKHPEDIELLHNRLNEFFRRATEGIQADPAAELSTLEELFTFMERKLETKLQPMDKVRIVRHPQRICLRDILENVYDNFTEIGGQEEHSIDPSMLIARAVITRRRGKKIARAGQKYKTTILFYYTCFLAGRKPKGCKFLKEFPA